MSPAPSLTAPWQEALDEIMTEVAVTTEAGLPPACHPPGLNALVSFARASGTMVPDGYLLLLQQVNGVTQPEGVRVLGLGVPLLDDFDREDFLIFNHRSAARLGCTPGQVVYATLKNTVLCYDPAHRKFEHFDFRTSTSVAAFESFDEALATFLRAVVPATSGHGG